MESKIQQKLQSDELEVGERWRAKGGKKFKELVSSWTKKR